MNLLNTTTIRKRLRAAIEAGGTGERREFWSQTASVAVFAFGALVLVACSLEILALRDFLTRIAVMKANTALAFLLSGVSLWLLRGRPDLSGYSERVRTRRILAGCYAVVVILIGLLTVVENAAGWDAGTSRMLARPRAGDHGLLQAGRMGLGSAINFVLIGSALLLLDVRRHQRLVRGLAVAAAVVSLPGLVGNAFGARFLLESAADSGMAQPTALVFIALCAGLLCVRQPRTAEDPEGGTR